MTRAAQGWEDESSIASAATSLIDGMKAALSSYEKYGGRVVKAFAPVYSLLITTTFPVHDPPMELKCIYGCNSPVSIYVALSHGTPDRPSDREQLLCTEHALKLNPIGDYFVISEVKNWNAGGMN